MATYIIKFESDIEKAVNSIKSFRVLFVIYDNELTGSSADERIVSRLIGEGLTLKDTYPNGYGGKRYVFYYEEMAV